MKAKANRAVLEKVVAYNTSRDRVETTCLGDICRQLEPSQIKEIQVISDLAPVSKLIPTAKFTFPKKLVPGKKISVSITTPEKLALVTTGILREVKITLIIDTGKSKSKIKKGAK